MARRSLTSSQKMILRLSGIPSMGTFLSTEKGNPVGTPSLG
jgi:hypothetical protein